MSEFLEFLVNSFGFFILGLSGIITIVFFKYLFRKFTRRIYIIPPNNNPNLPAVIIQKKQLLPEIIDTLQQDPAQIFNKNYPLPKFVLDKYILITDPIQLQKICTEILQNSKILGVDVENDSNHSYYGKVCLIQISTTDQTFIIDTISIESDKVATSLKPVFENPNIIKVFHDCRSDLLWLQRDFNKLLCYNIFDTQYLANKLKKFKSLGLEKLWKHYCGYSMSSELKKKYQTSDWTIRPLSNDHLNYAAADPHFLIYLRSAIICDYLKTNTLEGKEKESLINVLHEMQKLSTEKIYDRTLYKRSDDWFNILKTKLCVITETSCITEKIFEFLWKERDLEAQRKNFNPDKICPTEVMLAISMQIPGSETELKKVVCENYKYELTDFIKSHSNDLIQQIIKIKSKWNENPLKMREKSRLLNRNNNAALNQRKQERKEKQAAEILPKKPLYENCRILAPDGEQLCNCDKRKIEWYIKKGLGDIISENPTTLKLKFDPAGRKERTQKDIEDDQFYNEKRDNLCVICGCKENLQRYHVVPLIYRQHLPEELKAHRSHDVVLMCISCHENSTKDAEELKQELAVKYNAPVIDKTRQAAIKKSMKAKGLAQKLLKIKAPKTDDEKKVVESMRLNLLKSIEILIKIGIIKPLKKENDISEEELKQISDMELPDLEEHHGEQIIKSIDDLGEFIKMWRRRFVDKLKPKFLPKGWSVDHRIDRSFGKLSAFKSDNS